MMHGGGGRRRRKDAMPIHDAAAHVEGGLMRVLFRKTTSVPCFYHIRVSVVA